MRVQFQGMTHYRGPSASITRELLAKKPDHVLRAKIQEGDEALYISGADLACCVKDKFNLTVPKSLVEHDPVEPNYRKLNWFQRLRQTLYNNKIQNQSRQFQADLENLTAEMKTTGNYEVNPFFAYYDEAKINHHGKDLSGKPIEEIVHYNAAYGPGLLTMSEILE